MSEIEASAILLNSNDYVREITKLRAENEILKKMLKAAKLKIKQQEKILQNNNSCKPMYLQKYT